MNTLFVLRWLHIIGATVLLGTGIGIAFFMLMAHRSSNVAAIAHTARVVVIADYLFTATAAVVQPVTGFLLVQKVGWPWTQGWIVVSLALYLFVGALWLPVVWMQTQMRNLAERALTTSTPLPEPYFQLFRRWFAFGVPAFLAVLVILWLMVAKPSVTIL